MEWLRSFGSALIAPVTEYLRGRNERARIRAEASAEVVRTQADSAAADVAAGNVVEQTQTEAERDWDLLTATQAATSWKDELWTLVFALPIVAAFVPPIWLILPQGGAGLVMAGFQAISGAPGWFQAGSAASIAFAFGLRHIVQVMQSRWGARP